MELIECVPNVSEGRNTAIIKHLAHVISSVEHVTLLHVDSGFAANRTVYTCIGPPNSIIEAAFQLFAEASRLISMKFHEGEHPRIGVVDVCPLIPVSDITIEQTKKYAEKLAKRVGEELQIPIYLYEENAKFAYRKKLEQIRKGEYEGLSQKMLLQDWKPDYGPHNFNLQTGACVIGARKFLLAFNVNLETKDVQIAKNIAVQIRESGGKYVTSDGIISYSHGLLKGVKAIGWYIKDFDKVQVSTNITDYSVTSMCTVFQEISKLAKQYNTVVTGSELIGLIPLGALKQCAVEILHKEHIEMQDLQHVIALLHLNEIKEFNPYKHILEYIAEVY